MVHTILQDKLHGQITVMSKLLKEDMIEQCVDWKVNWKKVFESVGNVLYVGNEVHIRSLSFNIGKKWVAAIGIKPVSPCSIYFLAHTPGVYDLTFYFVKKDGKMELISEVTKYHLNKRDVWETKKLEMGIISGFTKLDNYKSIRCYIKIKTELAQDMAWSSSRNNENILLHPEATLKNTKVDKDLSYGEILWKFNWKKTVAIFGQNAKKSIKTNLRSNKVKILDNHEVSLGIKSTKPFCIYFLNLKQKGIFDLTMYLVNENGKMSCLDYVNGLDMKSNDTWQLAVELSKIEKFLHSSHMIVVRCEMMLKIPSDVKEPTQTTIKDPNLQNKPEIQEETVLCPLAQTSYSDAIQNPRNTIHEQKNTIQIESKSSTVNKEKKGGRRKSKKKCRVLKSDRSELIPPTSDKPLDYELNPSTHSDEILGSTIYTASSFSPNYIENNPELVFVDPECENVGNSKHVQSNDHIMKKNLTKNGGQNSKGNSQNDQENNQQVMDMIDTNISIFSPRDCEKKSTTNGHKQSKESTNSEKFTKLPNSEVLDNSAVEEVPSADSENDIYLEYLKAYNTIEDSPKHYEVYPECDYRIICQDKLHEIINCHRNVLCSNSSVFKKIMTGNSLNEATVHVSSASSLTMKKLIESMYNKIPDKASMDIALLDAAVKYNVVSLLEVYKADLEEVLNLENVVDVILGAHRQNIEFYKRCAIEFIRKHWEQVKLSSNIEKLKGHSDLLFEILLNVKI